MKRLIVAVALILSGTVASAQTVRVERTLAPPATTLQNAATANGNGATVTVTGYAAVLIDVTCASCSGGTTVTFQVSADGSTFTNQYAWQVGTQATTATTATTTSLWQLAVPSGITAVRAPISAYSAGTVTVKAYLGVLPPSPLTVNANVPGNVTVLQPTAANLNATVVGTGTFTTQAQQNGTWTVQPGNTANTTAWKVDGSAVTQPVSGTVTANAGSGTFTIQSNASVNQTQWNGTTVDTNSGTKSAGTVRVVLATDQPALTNKLLVTPDSVALPANQSVNVNQVNGAAVASPDANSYVIFTSAATATTAAGTSTCYAASAASTNSTNCKASAGNLYAIHVTNTTTTNYFLRLYNLSSAPTCSSATGFVETIPALGAAANGGVNGRINMPPQAFSTGIGFCFTGGSSSTDNTNAATGVTITLLYK